MTYSLLKEIRTKLLLIGMFLIYNLLPWKHNEKTINFYLSIQFHFQTMLLRNKLLEHACQKLLREQDNAQNMLEIQALDVRSWQEFNKYYLKVQ